MPTVKKIREQLTSVETVIEVTPDGADGDAYEAWLRPRRPRHAVRRHPWTTCAWSCTPRAPPAGPRAYAQPPQHGHAHVNAHDGWEFAPGDKSMVAMPLFHVGGSSYVLFGIHDGVPSVMTRDPDGASLAGAI